MAVRTANEQHVYLQFNEARGYIDKDINEFTSSYIEDYQSWLSTRQAERSEFRSILDYLNIPYKSGSDVEVGKGKIDSLVSRYDTRLLTEYASNMTINPDRIIDGKLVVCDGHSEVVKGNISNFLIYPIHTIFTHNPYILSDISNWDRLPSHTCSRLFVGVYGEETDADKNRKIEMVDKLADKMDAYDSIDSYVVNGSYYYLLNYVPKTKINVRTR